MSDRSLRALGWIVWLGSIGLAASGLALILPHRELSILNIPQAVASAAIGVTYATVGGFLADRRPRHAVAWIFLVIGLSQSFSVFALDGTASIMLGGRSTWMNVLAWMEGWTWEPGFVLLATLLLQLFPTGRPLSDRWRWLSRLTIFGIALGVVGLAFHPQSVGTNINANVPPGYRSPVPVTSATDPLAILAVLILVGCLFASVVSLVLRYRRSRGEEREQLKWFVAAAIGTVVFLTGGALLPPSAPNALRVLTFVGIPLIPIATAIAILKYRLYDIDVVINKAVVYGLLAAFITGVYVAIVVGIGAALGHGTSRPNLALSILATAVVAIAFQPVRDRVQKLTNRLVYGVRATPYEVLAGFVEQVGGTYAAEDVLPRMARALTEGTAAASATVWLRVRSELRPEASWPADGVAPPAVPLDGESVPDIPDASLTLPVIHRGETLGALTLRKPPGEPLSATERKLAEDLAGQAGLVLRNVGLTQDLLDRLRDIESSRARLVSAEDEERSRIQRRIRDGARRELQTVSAALDDAAAALPSNGERALTDLAAVTERGTVALESLREVARGIYPPLLADKGLTAALEAQARRARIPVEVAADGVGRYPQDVEAAVYFCCVEALENALTHGAPTSVRVSVAQGDDAVSFDVSDDGSGFDTTAVREGIGLTGMRDRVDALEGRLRISSSPGAGTTVVGTIPLAPVGAAV
jgi:signal transduction histidine kinase